MKTYEISDGNTTLQFDADKPPTEQDALEILNQYKGTASQSPLNQEDRDKEKLLNEINQLPIVKLSRDIPKSMTAGYGLAASVLAGQPEEESLTYYKPETIPGNIAKVTTSLLADPTGSMETGFNLLGAGLKGIPKAGTALITAEQLIEKTANKAAGVLARSVTNASNKVKEYVARNPSIVLSRKTRNIGDVPDLWQQTNKQIENTFRAIKAKYGKQTAVIQKELNDRSQNYFISGMDEIASMINTEKLAPYNKYATDTKELLNIMKESILKPKIGKYGAYETYNINEIEKVLKTIKGSDIYNKIQKEATGKISEGGRAAYNILKNIEKLRDDIYSKVEDDLLKKGYAITKGMYTKIKRLEDYINLKEPATVGQTIAKALQINNEELFDTLREVLPKPLIDKSISAFISLSKPEKQRLYAALSNKFYIGAGESLKGLNRPLAKFLVGFAKDKKPISATTKGSSFLYRSGQAARKALESESLKQAARVQATRAGIKLSEFLTKRKD